jgi:hypothetical protein
LKGIALKLEGSETPFLELPDARFTGARLDLIKEQIWIEKLTIAGGRAGIAVDESGTVNVERIVRGAGSREGPQSKTNGVPKPWTLELAVLDLSGFAADYRDRDRFMAQVDAIKTTLGVRVEAGEKAAKVLISDIDMTLSGVRAAQPAEREPDVVITRITLGGASYRSEPNAFNAEKVSVQGGVVNLKRMPDGSLNLSQLTEPPQNGAGGIESPGAVAGGRPLQFISKAIEVSGLNLKVFDLTVKPEAPVIDIDELAVALTDVDGKSPMSFTADFRVREGGRVKAGGIVNPGGPAVEADVRVSDIEIPAFQPYLSPAADIDLKSGTFSTHGKVRHAATPDGARTDYQGVLELRNLRITERGRGETLVGWKSVQTDQLSIQLEPNRLEIGDLKLLQPTGAFIIQKDRSFNMTNVVKSDPKAEKDSAHTELASGDGNAFPYLIRRIVVAEGEVEFADLSLMTPFSTKIHQLKGVVTGISSSEKDRAGINLEGRVEDYGTANVDGELNTSNPKAFTDIRVRFRNLEMSRLTPYSGEFAGRKIRSGKLSADLKYKVTQSQLAGDNKLVVDRLTLGEKVKSPGAVNLPLDLAVALLQDSSGIIDLGLPVKGNLDSPEFSYGALIGKRSAT